MKKYKNEEKKMVTKQPEAPEPSEIVFFRLNGKQSVRRIQQLHQLHLHWLQ